jgi:CRISPR-associated protein (TIGR02710 family)
MKKALVQSVGTGTRLGMDITQPLRWHLQKSHPDFVVWVVSDESQAHAERMAQEMHFNQERYEFRRVTAFEDVERVYRDCRALLRDLGAQGFPASSIEVDYTSGTKAMTAGLALAAVAHGCGTLSYIAGDRDAGVVISGTERVVSVEPRRLWADQRIQLAGDYCRALRFDAAMALVEGLNDAWLGEYERTLVAGLALVAAGYGAWDRFDYARGIGELTKLLAVEAGECAAFRPDRVLVGLLHALNSERGITADRLADLCNNARRRLDEGRYDDALARLYRLAEMLAQWNLSKDFGIQSEDVDLNRVPAAVRSVLESRRDADGRVRIGLEWDYTLLKELGHPVGREFDTGASRGIGVLLKQRNESLLAHGLRPIGKGEVESLLGKLEALVGLEVPDFSSRREALEFPWRRPAPAGHASGGGRDGDSICGTCI